MGLMTKWIDSLRSGEYEQCQGQLFYDGAYCPLGVLYEILPAKLKSNHENYIDENIYNYLNEKIGVNQDIQSRIIDMNDDNDRSFDYISNYIADEIQEGRLKDIELSELIK